MQLQLIALEPPGNVARDLSLYKRRLFSGLGVGSSLAFPEILPLAFAAKAAPPASMALAACWDGIGDGFTSDGLLVIKGILYLALRGPIERLSSRVAELMSGRGGGLYPLDPPLEPGVGFFLCRPDSDPETALSEALVLEPPRADFRDCALVVLDLSFGPDPFAAVAWRETARAKRRTGRPRGATSGSG